MYECFIQDEFGKYRIPDEGIAQLTEKVNVSEWELAEAIKSRNEALIEADKKITGGIVDEINALPNTTILTPYVPVAILGDDKVTGAIIKNVETGEEKTLEVQGVFPLVGQIPNSTYIKIPGVTNEWGTIPVDPKTKQTSVEGLYAGGDILPRDIRQIYLSEVDGKAACKAILEYLKK